MLIQWLKGDQLYLFPQNIFLFLKTHQLSHSYYTETAVLDTTNKKACIFLLWCLWRLLYLLHLSSECQRNGSGNLFSWHSFAANNNNMFFILGNFKIFLSHPKVMRVLCNSLHYIATAAPVFSCQYGIVLTLYREALLQNWWALWRRGRQMLVLLFYCLFL